jgi:hypothetical protein
VLRLSKDRVSKNRQSEQLKVAFGLQNRDIVRSKEQSKQGRHVEKLRKEREKPKGLRERRDDLDGFQSMRHEREVLLSMHDVGRMTEERQAKSRSVRVYRKRREEGVQNGETYAKLLRLRDLFSDSQSSCSNSEGSMTARSIATGRPRCLPRIMTQHMTSLLKTLKLPQRE